MSSDRDFYDGRVPLPGGDAGAGRPDAAAGPIRSRRDSVRRVRQISNWTAAALIAGTGAVTVALASNALHLGGSSASSSGSNAVAGTQGPAAPSVGGRSPRRAGPGSPSPSRSSTATW